MKTLDDQWVDELVDQPETGMGYQEVEIETNDGDVYQTIVMNSEELVEDLPIENDDIKSISVV